MARSTAAKAPHQSRRHRRQAWEIALQAVTSRVLMLLAMSLSCALLPDFYPGDDVLQFDLRLLPSDESELPCFCVQGHSCDANWESRRKYSGEMLCADSTIVNGISEHRKTTGRRNIWLDRFYAFVLPPVTRWDGARFLTLSVDPWARYPPRWPLNNNTDDQSRCSSNDAMTCEVPSDSEDDDKRFYASEQAHAFLPLLPLAIRYTANFLVKVVPLDILPPTYEATAALSGIILNTVAFVIATIALYDLTIYMLKWDALDRESSIDDDSTHRLLARTAAHLFCINPAGVFFTAAYSESVFAMLTFAGHAIAARGQYYRCRLQRDAAKAPGPEKRCEGSGWVGLYWIASTVLWMLASYTRSNGTFSSIWLIIVGVAKCCSYIVTNSKTNESMGISQVAVQFFSTIMIHSGLALLVAYPVHYHDRRGYSFHCLDQMEHLIANGPDWCGAGHSRPGFSLYAHVQRKHWNVGLFRYYELKQVPNFILALPVLSLSFIAAATWIRRSWARYVNEELGASHEKCVRDISFVARNAFPWAFHSLSASACGLFPHKLTSASAKKDRNLALMLLGPKFLSYFAILAGFAVVGTVLAHVQISTRLICSSCPAFYWFSLSLVAPVLDESEGYSGNRIGNLDTRLIVYTYFSLYNILGTIMHVNWLPWT